MTLLVNSTGLLAEIDSGSELDMLSVYKSENLGNFEETTNPVLVKDPYVQRNCNTILPMTSTSSACM